MRAQSLLLITFLVASLPAAARDCARDEAIAAENIAGRLTQWPDIHAAYARFQHCDDGAIAEGFTDSIVRLLASRWQSLPEAATLAEKDPKFLSFLLRHIDGSADKADLRRIAELAHSSCPNGHAPLCAAIRRAALEK